MNDARRRLSSMLAQTPQPIAQEETRLLQELIQGHCGVVYGIDSGFFLARRIAPRLEALGLGTFRDYYYYLRYDANGPAELETLVERITTHETYFFREQYQLDALSDQIFPEIYTKNIRSRRLNVWSAGCSTGEEVYTVAMLLLESQQLRNWQLRVIGSDISRQVISKARSAQYGLSSFRTTPEWAKDKYFCSSDVPDYWQPIQEVRGICSFGQLNLLSVERYGVIGTCDIILCRNVLMYLSHESRLRIVEAFYDLLVPGGYLLLGHSESLLNVSTRFDIVHFDKDLVYQKSQRTR